MSLIKGLKGVIYIDGEQEIVTLKSIDTDGNEIWVSNDNWVYSSLNYDIKIICRTLSDLTKEIEVNGEKFVPIYRVNDIPYKSNFIHPPKQGICDRDIDETLCFAAGGSWEGGVEEGIDTFQFLTLYNKLYEWHFDIHGLIEKGLAIDINTLNK